MKAQGIINRTFGRHAVGAVTVCVGFVLALPAVAQESIPNGDWEQGYITSSGDTIPDVWGNRVRDSGCTSNGTCLRWDDEVKAEGNASGRIVGTSEDGSIILVNGINGVTPGHEYKVTGKYMSDIGPSDNGSIGVALIPKCSGGGYKQIRYLRIVRESYSTDGNWIDFEGYATAPTYAECEDVGLRVPGVEIHIFFNHAGTVWFDDFQVVDLSTSTVPLTPGRNGAPQGIVLAERSVTFAQPTDYAIAILRPNGQLHAVRKGSGSSAELFRGAVPAGTYLVKVSSGLGNACRTVAVGR